MIEAATVEHSKNEPSGEGPLGLIAGGGFLPVRLAQACRGSGRDLFVIALDGANVDPALLDYPHRVLHVSKPGTIERVLKDNDVHDVVLAGLVERPVFRKLRPDWKGVKLLPRIWGAARKGDAQLLSAVVDVFEESGFNVVGADQVMEGLLMPSGALGTNRPKDDNLSDIVRAARVVRTLGSLDVGQAAVVREGLVLAVEAAEGTDRMLDRVAELSDETETGRAGVVFKAPKPGQEMRVDLPVIGPETVRRAAAAGLAGIAVASRQALIIDKEETVAEADRLGLFVFGASEDVLQRGD